MPNMKHESKRKVVTVEEHLITFNRDELADLLKDVLPEETEIDPRDIKLCAVVGNAESVIGPTDLKKIAREKVEDIPDDAEIVFSVRWRKEVERPPAAPMVSPAMYQAQQAGMVPPPAAPAATLPADSEMVASGAPCGTCGSVPDLHGPTPDCEDEEGCGRVRHLKGELPIATAKPRESEASVPGTGVPGVQGGPGTRYLVNRETGERVFAGEDGSPYGHHDDYTRQ